ncbi:hypothetical protein ASPZODRAFT_27045 [Penicilliopsis zonata CBS 506.65]|uniref:Uncharacterized protein n=1 Tax=Penicilliopsis zonata CBS 506.65 TaxID=1073090 RepID=A0A1L9SD37_9EURO|nr:hypothetical protein ASPZODRAFT_27045 [Penicilliopsis zonata CBS 506.65]OJJ45014.1 hypothetical protein ASPZODRAFT_27045 [Penicilliopsis zonata CBS 506.65]
MAIISITSVISRASDIANSRAAMSGITSAERQGACSPTTRNLLTLVERLCRVFALY